MEQKWEHICEIIPPYILQNIAQRGTPAQQEKAQRGLLVSAALRSQRQARAEFTSLVETAAALAKDRAIYDGQQEASLPGQLARSEGQPPVADTAVNEAYSGSGTTYDLFNDIFGRNSIDNNGLQLVSTVHYLQGYDNAFWNGQQMVYGDGDEDLPPDEQLFNRFTKSLDVIGHELTHGVTQFEANLTYSYQPGALNESFSDVFGSLVKQYTLNQTADQADWLIGTDLFTENVNGIALRSMKAPGTAYDDPILGQDPQPAHMDDYQNVPYDYGGVHINSGIPNHAFYLIATELGGYAWEKAGQIWYVTLRDKLQSNSNFQDAVRETIIVAGELFGVDSPEQMAVRHGWQAVGLGENGNGDSEPEGCWSALAGILGLRRS